MALTAGLLVGCSAAQNEDAAKAAATYSDKLAAWSQELSTAAETARTATTDEWSAAATGGLGFDEVGLGEVLQSAPRLKEFPASEVANTPRYRTATRAAKQVDAIVEELTGFEPEAITALRQASADSYWVIADLYYNTLSGPSTDRLTAQGEAYAHTDDLPAFDKILRDSSLSFAKDRLQLVDVAVTDMGGTAKGETRPVIPAEGLGVSIGAFIIDWLKEEEAYQKDMVEEIGSWKTLGAQSDSFLNFSNVNGTFTAPEEHAAALRAAFVAQVGDVSTMLSTVTHPGADPKKPARFPALGDPYRQVLLDGYLPWEDPAESPEHTVDRLWMLWHIRELENTPDAAYTSARVAVLEELNRSIEDGGALDVRPGSGRILSFIRANTLTFVFSFDEPTNKGVVAGVKELLGYGEMLRRYPMTPELSTSFDAVLKLSAELVGDMTAAIDDNPDEGDQWAALNKLKDTYNEKVYDVALPPLERLEDDASAQPLTAAAIEWTAPGRDTSE